MIKSFTVWNNHLITLETMRGSIWILGWQSSWWPILIKFKVSIEASKSTQNPEFQNILTKNDDFRAKKSQRELKFPAPYSQLHLYFHSVVLVYMLLKCFIIWSSVTLNVNNNTTADKICITLQIADNLSTTILKTN